MKRDAGHNSPAPFGNYAIPLGSPGSTTSGQFRFACSAAQAPCKISIGAAVLSTRDTPTARFHARLLIHKDAPTSASPAPIVSCEYADGDNNSGPGIATIQRVLSFEAARDEMRKKINMGIGGSLDCGSGQSSSTGIVDEIWVPAASAVDTAYYDVWATVAFGDEAPEQGRRRQ